MRIWMFAFAVLAVLGTARAEEQSLKKYTAPAESSKDEPIAKQFSLDKAVSFLDNVALDWTKKRGCFSCHSNYAYLYARPMISAEAAEFLLAMDFGEADRQRMERLAERSQAGTLTAEEQAEFDGYLHVGNLLAVMQSKARLALKRKPYDRPHS